jgi:CRP/FNR family transcriptional regulator, cyclic AMP receptor protein
MQTHPVDPTEVADAQKQKAAGLRPSSAATVHVHFGSVPLFSECSKKELRMIAKSAVVEPRATGATLVVEGQPGTNAFVILQGTCRVLRNGRRVGEVGPGGVVGELSMLNRGPRNATVIADSPLEVAILERGDFLELLDHSPSICHKLLVRLAARVQELDARTPA